MHTYVTGVLYNLCTLVLNYMFIVKHVHCTCCIAFRRGGVPVKVIVALHVYIVDIPYLLNQTPLPITHSN